MSLLLFMLVAGVLLGPLYYGPGAGSCDGPARGIPPPDERPPYFDKHGIRHDQERPHLSGGVDQRCCCGHIHPRRKQEWYRIPIDMEWGVTADCSWYHKLVPKDGKLVFDFVAADRPHACPKLSKEQRGGSY